MVGLHTRWAAGTSTRSGTTLLVALGVTLAGCQEPAGTEPSVLLEIETSRGGVARFGNGRDHELAELIASQAPGDQGLDYFVLPWNSRQLNRIPQDQKNPLTRDKVELGRLLYHETALAVNNVHPAGREAYSCASCHHVQGGFQANLPQGIAEGGSGFGLRGEGRTMLPDYDSDPLVPDVQPIRTPTVLNCAYQELMLWNGQFGGVGDNLGTEDNWTPGSPKESNFLGLHGLETQAHAGLKVHRMTDIEFSRVAADPTYKRLFRKAFPGEPQPISHFNAALAIAAYERTILASQAPFQRWLRGDRAALSDLEKSGAAIFFGKAGCVGCHTGPALNSMTFHALGMHDLDGAYDPSRVDLRPTAGTIPPDVRMGRGGFTGRAEDHYKFKTPQLYNLVDSPFYGHGASFASVREVIEYKNAAIPENPVVPGAQLSPLFTPLNLHPFEIDALVAFLEKALYDKNLERFVPRRVPSGNCFPVNDGQAAIDLGCD